MNGIYLENDDFSFLNIDDGLLGITFDCPDTILSKGPPIYKGQKPNVCLQLSDVSSVSIGKDFQSYGCVFKNAKTGVLSERSSFTAEGNTFQDLGTGIFYRNGTATNGVVSIGGDGTYSPNQFVRMAIGIRAYNVCVTCNLNIDNNDFDNTGLPEAAATRFYNTAITVQNPVSAFVPGLTPSVHINNNTIDNCRIGIHASNMPEIVIGALTNSSIGYGNNITFNLTQFPLSDFHEGIWLQSCTNAKVVNNSVANSTFTADPNFRGIDIETSPDCDINCNFIDKAGIAVNFYDNCNLTRLRDNTFNQYGTGIMLNGPNGASINADQGGTGDAWDNDWFPLASSSGLKVDGDLYGGLNPINWYHQCADNSGNPWSPRPWNTVNGNIINKFELQSSGNVTCNDFSRYAINRISNFGNFIGDSANFTSDSALTLYEAKNAAYSAMIRDSTIINQQDEFDNAFEGFYLNNDTSNVGRFNKIKMLAITEPDSAELINSLITSINEIETIKKSFNELFFEKISNDGSLNPSDSSFLEGLTLLSRSVYGEVVHNASATLFIEKHPEPSNERITSEHLSVPVDSEFINQLNSITVYPNPASNSITIVSNSEMSFVELLNVFGSLIAEFAFKGTSIKIKVENLPDGVYLAKVFYLGIEKPEFKKFVVQK